MFRIALMEHNQKSRSAVRTLKPGSHIYLVLNPFVTYTAAILFFTCLIFILKTTYHMKLKSRIHLSIKNTPFGEINQKFSTMGKHDSC